MVRSSGSLLCWLVAYLMSLQHPCVSKGWICSYNCTCCHTEIEAADQTFYFIQSKYTDTGPTSLSNDPIMPGAWQGSCCGANFNVTGMTRPGKFPWHRRKLNPGSAALEAYALTTKPKRSSSGSQQVKEHSFLTAVYACKQEIQVCARPQPFLHFLHGENI